MVRLAWYASAQEGRLAMKKWSASSGFKNVPEAAFRRAIKPIPTITIAAKLEWVASQLAD